MQGMAQGNSGMVSTPRPVGPDQDLETELDQRASDAANAAVDLEQRAAELRRVELALRAGLETLGQKTAV